MPAQHRETAVRGDDLDGLLAGAEAVARPRCAPRAARAVATDTRHVALGLAHLDGALGAVAQDAVQSANAAELATLLVADAGARSTRTLQSAVAMNGVAIMVDTIAVRVRDLVETLALGPVDRDAVADAAVLVDLTRRASDTVARRAADATAEAAELVAELDELAVLLTDARARQATLSTTLARHAATATTLRTSADGAPPAAGESALVPGGMPDEGAPRG